MTIQRRRPILVLALGNDLLGDDGVALLAARALQEEFADGADVVETSEAGLALLESLEGYERALILDSITTGHHAPGTVLELAPEDFRALAAPSPHYAGLPDVLELGRRLGVSMPAQLRILVMEIAAPGALGGALTAPIAGALPSFISRARAILREDTSHTKPAAA